MNSRIRVLLILIAAAMLLAGSVSAVWAAPQSAGEKQEASPEAKPSEQPKPPLDKSEPKKEEAGKDASAEPPTYTAKKAPLKIELSLKATFEAQQMAGVFVRLKEWKTLQVVKASPHGARVKKGDVLVEFETEDLDRAIADLKTEQTLAELTLRQAEQTLKLLEASTPLDLAAAERAKRIADEDLARFLRIDRPMSQKSEAFMLKMAENSLQYELEELRQLEKMYKADDLTEETEEIILKRQRDTVERAKFNVEVAKVLYEQAMQVQLPREEENRTQRAQRETLAQKKASATLPLALQQQRLEVEKLKVQQLRNADKLKKLLADREAMKVVAPIDGIVYYGQYVRGEWSNSAAAADDLRPGGDVTSGQIFLTVVQPRPLIVRAAVAEKELQYLRPGQRATVEATGYPDRPLAATVTKVDAVPAVGNKFEATLAVALDRQDEALMPGMTCTVKIVPYVNAQALTIPVGALFTDELDPQQQYVYLVPKGGPPKKHPVKAGKKNDQRVEILQGLQPGDRVLQEKPKDDGK